MLNATSIATLHAEPGRRPGQATLRPYLGCSCANGWTLRPTVGASSDERNFDLESPPGT